jgi:hypothetical protein
MTAKLSERREVMASNTPSPPWLHARAFWAGLSIIVMWLAVLFVGVFGGNILHADASGSSSSVPVVVAVLPFVLPATIVVARRGFAGGSDEPHGALEEEPEPREAETTERPVMRSKLA